MKPTPFEWLLASRYTLPVWIGLAIWFYYAQEVWNWDNWHQDRQLATVIMGAAFAFMYLKSFPTTFFYERELARYKRSSMSPEERWQRATVTQTFFLVLLAAALLYGGFQWWKSTPEPEPVSYKAAAAGIGSVSILATTAYLKARNGRDTPQKDQPATCSWCLPVAKQSTIQVIQLPDYCQRVMTAAKHTTT